MKSRMPERARTDPREPWGSNPLGPPGPELLSLSRRSTSLPGARKWVAPSALAPPAPYHERAYVENGQTTAEDLCATCSEMNGRPLVSLGRSSSLGKQTF